jgi:hypothetical protein
MSVANFTVANFIDCLVRMMASRRPVSTGSGVPARFSAPQPSLDFARGLE